MWYLSYVVWQLTYWLYALFGAEWDTLQVGVSPRIPDEQASGYFSYEQGGTAIHMPYLVNTRAALHRPSKTITASLFRQIEQLGFHPTSISIRALDGRSRFTRDSVQLRKLRNHPSCLHL